MNGYVRARVDEHVKDEAAAVLANIGLNVSDIIRVVLTRIAKEKAIPSGLFTPNATTVAAMEEARELMISEKARFNDPQEMFDAIQAEDTKQNKD